MSLQDWWDRMLTTLGRGPVGTPPVVGDETSAVDTDAIDRRQLEALQRLRRVENRLRGYQVEVDIIRGD